MAIEIQHDVNKVVSSVPDLRSRRRELRVSEYKPTGVGVDVSRLKDNPDFTWNRPSIATNQLFSYTSALIKQAVRDSKDFMVPKPKMISDELDTPLSLLAVSGFMRRFDKGKPSKTMKVLCASLVAIGGMDVAPAAVVYTIPSETQARVEAQQQGQEITGETIFKSISIGGINNLGSETDDEYLKRIDKIKSQCGNLAERLNIFKANANYRYSVIGAAQRDIFDVVAIQDGNTHDLVLAPGKARSKLVWAKTPDADKLHLTADGNLGRSIEYTEKANSGVIFTQSQEFKGGKWVKSAEVEKVTWNQSEIDAALANAKRFKNLDYGKFENPAIKNGYVLSGVPLSNPRSIIDGDIAYWSTPMATVVDGRNTVVHIISLPWVNFIWNDNEVDLKNQNPGSGVSMTDVNKKYMTDWTGRQVVVNIYNPFTTNNIPLDNLNVSNIDSLRMTNKVIDAVRDNPNLLGFDSDTVGYGGLMNFMRP